ncbi:MAG: FliA/WhiG family RNA polymerase sigma factor [Candidatus Eremiobacteraeota bacterium]|nr:FliA/WhiG family RNA polymerase sigma factor [Candidatus Eremiobacteraeota bacterium]MCW5869038.1 FliA/WhiG family RNA polymerase sigma factor [Candidatus Eremiobacteraeota bacterium]
MIQNRLAEQYLPLVKSIAMGLSRKMGQSVDVDDMIADGSIGLIRAIDTFDIDRGFKFQTYATTVVRGAILNGMRRMDWVPERVRAKNRQVQQAIDRHQAETGETPSEEQLAEELKISTEEVYDLIANLGTTYLLSLEQPLGSEDGDASLGDMVDDDDDVPDIEFEYAEERDALRSAIQALDEREQLIITAHYFEGVTFDAISKILGVSKQRISQMHSRAVTRLRHALGDQEISPESMQGFTFESHA